MIVNKPCISIFADSFRILLHIQNIIHIEIYMNVIFMRPINNFLCSFRVHIFSVQNFIGLVKFFNHSALIRNNRFFYSQFFCYTDCGTVHSACHKNNFYAVVLKLFYCIFHIRAVFITPF